MVKPECSELTIPTWCHCATPNLRHTRHNLDRSYVCVVYIADSLTINWVRASVKRAPEERSTELLHVGRRTEEVIWQIYRKSLLIFSPCLIKGQYSMYAWLQCKISRNRVCATTDPPGLWTKTNQLLVLNTTHSNLKYSATERECLTVFWALYILRQYLMFENFTV